VYGTLDSFRSLLEQILHDRGKARDDHVRFAAAILSEPTAYPLTGAQEHALGEIQLAVELYDSNPGRRVTTPEYLDDDQLDGILRRYLPDLS
jgi:hypothetical protein